MPRKGKKVKNAKKKRVASVSEAEDEALEEQLKQLQLSDGSSTDSIGTTGDDTLTQCKHGHVPLPPGHVCNGFLNVFFRHLSKTNNEIQALLVTKRTHPKFGTMRSS